MLDPEGIELGVGAYSPVVAFTGKHFLVAFGGDYTQELRVVPVSASDGAVGATVVLSDDDAFDPTIASDGQRALVAFQYEPSVTNRSTRLMLLDDLGNPIHETSWPTPIPVTASVAGGPAGFAVYYQEYTYTSQWTPSSKVRRFGSAGAWIDAALDAPGSLYQRIARDGAGYLLAYPNGGFQTFRIDDGPWVPTTPAPVAGTEGAYRGALAADGTARALAWETSSARDVFHFRLDAAGAPLDTEPTATPRSSSASQLFPALGAAPGGTPVLAFCEATRDVSVVRYALTDAGAASAIGEVQQIADACEPQIATGADSTLMVWKSGTNLHGGLITTTGELAEVPVIGFTNLELDRPRVAPTPGGFAVGYRGVTLDADVTHESLDVVTLGSGGEKIGKTSLGSGVEAVPVAVGSGLLVAWSAYSSLGLTLFVGPPVAGGGSPATLGTLARDEPIAATSSGGRAFIAWVAEDDVRVMAALVDASGEIVVGPFPVSPSGHFARSPSVCFDGEHFVVVWRDLRAPWIDLYAARVTAEGVVRDIQGATVSSEPGNELAPSVFSPAPGEVLLAYGRLDPALGPVRVRTRQLATAVALIQ